MRRHPWVVLAAGITAWDCYLLATGYPTLSETFARAVRHPVRRWPTVASWVVISGHLFSVWPRRWDPIHRVASVLSPNGRV